MAQNARADRIVMSKSGMPIYGRNDGVAVLPDAGGDTTTTDGLIAVENGAVASTLSRAMFCEVFEDFLGGHDIPTSGDTIVNNSSPWFVKDTSAAGSPTKAIVADADNGQYALTFAATNEAEVLTLSFNDEQNIDSDQEPVFITRLSVDGTPGAATNLVIGLASAQNDTEDSVAQNAWFRLVPSSLALYCESDDATTDSDDKSTGITLTAATLYEFKVSMSAMDGAAYNNVKFFYRTALGGDWTNITPSAVTFKVAADTALQPFIQLSKTTGTATDGIKIDYVHCLWKRN